MAVDPLATALAGMPAVIAGRRKRRDPFASKQAYADALMKQGASGAPVGHWAEGLARAGTGLAGGLFGRMYEREEEAADKTKADKLASALQSDDPKEWAKGLSDYPELLAQIRIADVLDKRQRGAAAEGAKLLFPGATPGGPQPSGGPPQPMPGGEVGRTAMLESPTGGPNAMGSGADGYMQWMPKTAWEVGQQTAWGKGKSPDQIMAEIRAEVQASGGRGPGPKETEMKAIYDAQTNGALSAAGLPTSASNRFIAHRYGQAGGVSLLRADPNMPIGQWVQSVDWGGVAPAEVIRQNKLDPNMTVGEHRQQLTMLMAPGGVPRQQSAAVAPPQEAAPPNPIQPAQFTPGGNGASVGPGAPGGPIGPVFGPQPQGIPAGPPQIGPPMPTGGPTGMPPAPMPPSQPPQGPPPMPVSGPPAGVPPFPEYQPQAYPHRGQSAQMMAQAQEIEARAAALYRNPQTQQHVPPLMAEARRLKEQAAAAEREEKAFEAGEPGRRQKYDIDRRAASLQDEAAKRQVEADRRAEDAAKRTAGADIRKEGREAGTTPGAKEFEKYREAKAEAATMLGALGEFRDRIGKAPWDARLGAATGIGKEGGELNTSYYAAVLLAKGEQLFNLGVLNGPDLEVIRKTISDPSGWFNAAKPGTAIQGQVDIVTNLIKRRLAEKEKVLGLASSADAPPVASSPAGNAPAGPWDKYRK